MAQSPITIDGEYLLTHRSRICQIQPCFQVTKHNPSSNIPLIYTGDIDIGSRRTGIHLTSLLYFLECIPLSREFDFFERMPSSLEQFYFDLHERLHVLPMYPFYLVQLLS